MTMSSRSGKHNWYMSVMINMWTKYCVTLRYEEIGLNYNHPKSDTYASLLQRFSSELSIPDNVHPYCNVHINIKICLKLEIQCKTLWVPIIETMTPAEIARVFDWYSADLPQNATFQQEIHRWSTFCQDLKDKPSSLFEAFIFADPDYYPNIREIFHILLTMPIGSVPCERSFSALRSLK
jgi:hypothetical protein